MVAFWHYGRLLVTLKAARPAPHVNHRQNLNTGALAWKLWWHSLIEKKFTAFDIHIQWYQSRQPWHDTNIFGWVNVHQKMPFTLKIFPLSLSPFKSKNTGIFLYYGEILLKGSQPFDLWSPSSSCHRQHEQCSLNTIINMNIIIKIITIIIARSVLPGGDGDLNRSCRSRSGSLHGRLSEVLHLSFLIEYSHP